MRMIVIGSLCGTLALVTAGCDSDDADDTGSASTQGASGPGASGGAGGEGASGGQGGAGAQGGTGGSGASGGSSGGPCPADTVCLDVTANMGGPIEAGHVGVVWFQLSDDGPDPVPLVGYDAEFLGTEERIEIPLAEIGLPNADNLLCQRDCDDEAICPCVAEPQVGLAVVVVAKDADGSGALDGQEAFDFYGIGYMVVGYSEKEFIPAPAPYFDDKFPEGIEAGVRPYRIIESETFDDLGLSEDGDVFPMDVCNAPGPGCDPEFPNLT